MKKHRRAKKTPLRLRPRSTNVERLEESDADWLLRMNRLVRSRIEDQIRTARGIAFTQLAKMLQQDARRLMPAQKKLVIRFRPIGNEPPAQEQA